MAGVANHPELKQANQSHLEETHSQRDRLDEVLRRPDFRTIADFRKRHLAAPSERRVRAYLPPGRARHGEADAAGHRRLTKMPLMRAMADKLKRAGRRSRYRLRKQVVEPVFEQLKQARGFRQFLL